MSVANQIRIERKERAVTEAHLPHSAVPDHLSGCSAHWGDVDWLQADLSASSIAAALCPPAFGSGSRQLGLLKNAARVGQHITGFGGTQFLLQIPLFDVVTAFESQGVARPYDWASWSPPGPGCRATLFQLRPRWQREHKASRSRPHCTQRCTHPPVVSTKPNLTPCTPTSWPLPKLSLNNYSRCSLLHATGHVGIHRHHSALSHATYTSAEASLIHRCL